MESKPSLLTAPSVAKNGTERQSLLLDDDEGGVPPSPPVPTPELTSQRRKSLIQRIGSLGRKKPSATLGLLAARTLKLAVYHGYKGVDKLEAKLEAELEHENKAPSPSTIGRLRHSGEHQLHNKVVLVLVIVLNIIDCLLVMGELILDFHHVSHHLQMKLDMMESFTDNMKEKLSPKLDDIPDDPARSGQLLQTVLDSQIFLPPRSASSHVSNLSSRCEDLHNLTSAAFRQVSDFMAYHLLLNQSEARGCPPSAWDAGSGAGTVKHRTYTLTADGETDHTLIVVAHKLHYISVSILSVLVVLLLLKIFCAGKRFFKSRIQVFDGIVVIISFTLDLVFIKGITIFDVDEFVIILTLLLPWRILRVLNSLVVAVLDKQRLNLKIIYTQKKKISRSLTEQKTKVDVLQKQIQTLQLQLSKFQGTEETESSPDNSPDKTNHHHKLHIRLPHLNHHHHRHHHHHNNNGLEKLTVSALASQTVETLSPISPTPPLTGDGLNPFMYRRSPPATNGGPPQPNGEPPEVLDQEPIQASPAESVQEPATESSEDPTEDEVNSLSEDVEDGLRETVI